MIERDEQIEQIRNAMHAFYLFAPAAKKKTADDSIWFFPAVLPVGTSATARRLTPGASILAALAVVLAVVGYWPGTLQVPFLMLEPRPVWLERFPQILSFGFLHFDALHLAWNLPILLLLGPALEDEFGAWGLVLIYGVSAVVAALSGVAFEVLTASAAPAPSAAGASASVGGVLGAYIYLFPRSRLRWRGPRWAMTALERERLLPVRMRWVLVYFAGANLITVLAGWTRGFNWTAVGVHAIGCLTGLELAYLAWKFDIGARVAHDPGSARNVQVRLTQEIGTSPARKPVAAAAPKPMPTLALGPHLAELPEMIECTKAGQGGRAYELFIKTHNDWNETAVRWADQWALARLLIKQNFREGAIEVIKSLLRRHPHAPCSIRARFELGMLYLGDHGREDQAALYLRQALDPAVSEPSDSAMTVPEALPVEDRQRARTALAELEAKEHGAKMTKRKRDPDPTEEDWPDPFEDVEIRQQKQVDLARLFDPPSESSVGVPPDLDSMDESSAPSQPSASPPSPPDEQSTPIAFDRLIEQLPDAPDPKFDTGVPSKGDAGTSQAIPHETQGPIHLSQIAHGPVSAGGDAPESEQAPSLRPVRLEEVYEPVQVEARAAQGAHAETEPAPGGIDAENRPAQEARPEPPAGRSMDETQTDPDHIELHRTPEVVSIPPPAKKSRARRGVPMRIGRERRPRYDTDHLYSVVIVPHALLAPDKIIEVLQDFLGLSAEGVMHSIKRHHGILARDLERDQALDLAKRFSARGQNVLLVEQDERLDFGPVMDVIELSYDAKGILLLAGGQSHQRAWKELIALGCGFVTPEPGGPRDEIVDMFFAEPSRRFRLRRAALRVDPDRREDASLDPEAMRRMARDFARFSPGVIQTRAFRRWTLDTSGGPPEAFFSLIEFDHYSDWFLMAHYGRAKLITAED